MSHESHIQQDIAKSKSLSPWWRTGALLVVIVGFSVLIGITVNAYRQAPPIPEKVIDPSGNIVFTVEDVNAGQQVFLKHALMENGTIWGHGAYLGPDFSAEYLHSLALDTQQAFAQAQFGQTYDKLAQNDQLIVDANVQEALKTNRYDPTTGVLSVLQPEADSFANQITKWTDYFSGPGVSRGLEANFIRDPVEIRQLTAFFAWTAWASVANRPGNSFSYTNNFPYEPLVGNTPTNQALLWSALSLIGLLAGTAAVLFAFGRFSYLGWGGGGDRPTQALISPDTAPTASQRATVKFFAVVTLLMLAQGLAGALTAHYRADPSSFYGIDLSGIFPSNLVRTWHLQTAIFWIATAYVGGGLFLAVTLSGKEPSRQKVGVNFLFVALLIVVGGSLLGEVLGINQLLGKIWFWFGHQGWEFLDLGRGWQILLAIGLLFWVYLIMRAIAPARKIQERSEISSLFLIAATAIPVFYLPAMFFSSITNYTIVDTWRFWIIHLWVEGFFELFATTMVAIILFVMGIVSRKTAIRVVYLDAILFLGSGIIGTGHHWYWTGQTNINLAFSAMFSALEVVPLTLLTLDAWDFIRLTRGESDQPGQKNALSHKYTFYFLMAVGFWNFVGAGVFGFLINLPIVSYYEVGTVLTPNHGHAALMGAFGMLAIGLVVFTMRQVLSNDLWKRVENWVRVSFWGLNIGLALMVILNLFPGGVYQLYDVLKNGYWHARSAEFISTGWMHTFEWMRLPADLIFGIAGVLPIMIAALMTLWFTLNKKYGLKTSAAE